MARIRKSEDQALKKSLLWSIAVYIRLSREDGLDESKSITEQKKIITEFLEQFFTGEYVVADYYIDGADIIGLNQKTLIYRGCDKEGFEKPSKINGLRQQQTGNV